MKRKKQSKKKKKTEMGRKERREQKSKEKEKEKKKLDPPKNRRKFSCEYAPKYWIDSGSSNGLPRQKESRKSMGRQTKKKKKKKLSIEKISFYGRVVGKK
jgi:hypothetical protein